MSTFYIAHLPPEPTSLKLINFSQSTGIKYRISSDPERLDEFMTANGASSSSAERRNIFHGYESEAAEDRSLFDRGPPRSILNGKRPLPSVPAAVLLVGSSSTGPKGGGASGGTAVEREMTNRILNPVHVVEDSDGDESVIVLDGDDQGSVVAETGRQRLARILEEEFGIENKERPQRGIQKEMGKKDSEVNEPKKTAVCQSTIGYLYSSSDPESDGEFVQERPQRGIQKEMGKKDGKTAGNKVLDPIPPRASQEDEQHGQAVLRNTLRDENSQILMDLTEDEPAAQCGHLQAVEDSAEEDLGPVKKRKDTKAAGKRNEIISSDEESEEDSDVCQSTIGFLYSSSPESDGEFVENEMAWRQKRLSIDGEKTKKKKETVAAPIISKKSFSCEVCETTFPSLEKVVAHIRATRQKGRCCKCRARFINILEHIRRHGVVPEKKELKRTVCCRRRC